MRTIQPTPMMQLQLVREGNIPTSATQAQSLLELLVVVGQPALEPGLELPVLDMD